MTKRLGRSRRQAVIVVDEPVHEFFELSYSSYLVLPRSALQSMPVDWQHAFIRLVREISEHVRLVREDEKVDGPFGNYWPPVGTHIQVIVRDNKTGHTVSDPLGDYDRGRRQLPPLKPEDEG